MSTSGISGSDSESSGTAIAGCVRWDVRLRDGSDLPELLSSERFPFHRQEPSLSIIEQDSLAANLLTKDSTLQLKVLDDLFLFLAYQLNEHSKDYPQWLE